MLRVITYFGNYKALYFSLFYVNAIRSYCFNILHTFRALLIVLPISVFDKYHRHLNQIKSFSPVIYSLWNYVKIFQLIFISTESKYKFALPTMHYRTSKSLVFLSPRSLSFSRLAHHSCAAKLMLCKKKLGFLG